MFGSHRNDIERAQDLLGGYVFESDDQDTEEQDRVPQLSTLFPSCSSLICHAGLSEAAARKEKRLLLLLTFLISVFALLAGWPAAFLLLPPIALIQYVRLRKKSYSRAQSFEKDYPAFLLSVASGIRTGLDPMVAFGRAADLFSSKSLLRTEIEQLNENISSGMDEETAISTFAVTVNHPDIKLLRTTFILARREGSSLSVSLQRLAKVTRQRQSFRRKIRSAIAMQRMSIIGIAVCTVIIGLIQCATNMKALQDALTDPIGSKALLAGGCLISTGLLWMMQMAKARI